MILVGTIKTAYQSFKVGRKLLKLIKRALKEGDELRDAIVTLAQVCKVEAAAGYTDDGKRRIGEAATHVWVEGEDVWAQLSKVL
jgi:hypothetical protein